MKDIFIKKVINLAEEIKNIFDYFSDTVELGKAKLIVIKPNWVMARQEATTSQEVFRVVIKEIKKRSSARIVAVEGSGYEFDTEKTFEILGVYGLCRELGVELINSREKENEPIQINGRVFKTVRMPEVVAQADLIINLPKLKTHALTDISFAMKNLYGLIAKEDRHYGHRRGLSQSIVDLASYFNHKTLSIIDGLTAVVGQGPAFGDVIGPGVLLAGNNLFALDYLACRACNIEPSQVQHLKIADRDALISEEIKNYQPEIIIADFRPVSTGNIYRNIYRLVYLLDKILRPLVRKDLVMEIVTRLGTRVVIDKQKAKPFQQELINLCPVRAIKDNLEIDFLACRQIRCLKCWERFPQAVIIKGFSKPKNKDSD